MTKEDMQRTINKIAANGIISGISLFATLQQGETLVLKKIRATDKLLGNVASKLSSTLTGSFLAEDMELETAENVADNKNILYEIVQGETYYPFKLLDEYKAVTAYYERADRDNLIGFFIRVNNNDDSFWCYQHVYSMSKMDNSKSVLALFVKNTYDYFEDDVIRIDSRIDMIVIGQSILTRKINLLERSFGFEKFIRNGAKETIGVIEELGIVSGLDKFIALESKSKLTNAKKLMKARRSPVLQMEKSALLDGIQKHRRYSKVFTVVEDQIVISSQKDAAAFIKMINDDYVTSELTGQEYDSSSKQIIGPIEENN